MVAAVENRAILCLDVITNLFEHLSPGPRPSSKDPSWIYLEWQVRRRTLSSLARSHSAFTGPALDVLWRIIDDVCDLLAILPTYSAKSRSFQETIRDEHWPRFQLYASRVRWLHVNYHNGGRHSAPDDSTWTILAHRRSREPLIPHLDRLSISSHQVAALMMLLHSSITHLDLGKPEHVNSGPSALSLMVDIVRPHLPHIESLSLPSMMIRQTNDRDHALIQLAAFAHLRVMRLQNVEKYPLWTMATVTTIASFPKLRELEANFGFPADVRSSLHEKKIPMGFFELRKLTLVATPPDIAAFLDATDPPCLDSLTMVVSERRTAPVGRVYLSTEDLERFYPLIPRCIRRIELFLTQFHSPYARHPSLDLSASRLLHPVLRDLDTLREISVSVEHAAAGITDADMRELCATWPNLTHFEFVRWHGSLSSAPYYTMLPRFSTMLDFIRAHPHLVHLALPTLCVAGIPDVGTTVTAFPHVRHLRIGRLVRGTPLVPLAIALDSAFPNLDLGSVAATQVGSLSCSEEDEENDSYSQQSDRDDDTVTVECELILRAALLALQTSRRSQLRVCNMTDGRTPGLS